jgi:hypothetical protein
MAGISNAVDGGHGCARLTSDLDQTPDIGTHMTTSRFGYTHHGIYVGDGRIVHYPGLSAFRPSGSVQEVSVAEFALGHPVRVVHHLRLPFSPEEIVRRARSRLGEDNYRLLTNNCEHFCSWCLSGISRSPQVERRSGLPLLRRAWFRAKSPDPIFHWSTQKDTDHVAIT